MNEQRNILLAIVLSAAILFGWQYYSAKQHPPVAPQQATPAGAPGQPTPAPQASGTPQAPGAPGTVPAPAPGSPEAAPPPWPRRRGSASARPASAAPSRWWAAASTT